MNAEKEVILIGELAVREKVLLRMSLESFCI